MPTSSTPQPSQIDRFAELARALQCDEDEGRWEEKLKKVAAHKPKEDTDGKDN